MPSMKILFSPEYTGAVYARAQDGGDVMMDTDVLNTKGLLNMMELRLGLHYADTPEHELTVRYYDAVSKYLDNHRENVMYQSFKLSGLNTAKAMLRWRDGLRRAGWQSGGEDISSRMEALAGTEKIFESARPVDTAERLRTVSEQIDGQGLDCSDMEIELPCEKGKLMPLVASLLNTLEAHGARLKVSSQAENEGDNLSKVRALLDKTGKQSVRLEDGDDSLLVYEFADEKSAYEYLSYYDIDADVWINAHNKQMDNWLSRMGKPLTGSKMESCSPLLTQMLVMGIGLFSKPLDIKMLIEWLNMPISPLSATFRHRLADTITGKGGFFNDDCQRVIEDYIDGKFEYLSEEQRAQPEEEQEKIRQADRRVREKLARTFLPKDDDAIETEEVKMLVKELSAWARQRAHLMKDKDAQTLWAEQLSVLATMCDSMSLMLSTASAKTIEYKTLDSWMGAICKKGTYGNAVAEKGCRMVIDSPGKMASTASKTIWMGVEGDDVREKELSFLYPSEKEALTSQGLITPWEDEAQNRYNEIIAKQALRKTEKQLIIITCLSKDGEPTQKHPMLVRLQSQIENYEAIVRHPRIEERDTTEVEMITRDTETTLVNFEHSDAITWPDHLSHTTLSHLIEHPFDFMFEQILHIAPEGMAQMPDVKTTNGNVAHAMIEALFAPRNGASSVSADEVAELIDKEYDETYSKVLKSKGAILLLAENRIKEMLFRKQLRECLCTLVEVLRENKLRVTGCEHYVEGYLGLGLPAPKDAKEGQERDMVGYIDMTLEDESHKPVVFDFKWTSSKKHYDELLKENRSAQLELYRFMYSKEKRDAVDRVGYFLMPEGRLCSCDPFAGRHFTQITPDNKNNLIAQIKNSFEYRKNQIESGMLETNGTFEQLQYVQDTESKDLFPLQERDGVKSENKYSNYNRFKGQMR